MYAKNSERITSGMIRADIITTHAPAVFPLTSDSVSNLPNGLTLAPYSSIFVAAESKLFMLGTDSKWYQNKLFGSVNVNTGIDTPTDEEIGDITFD